MHSNKQSDYREHWRRNVVQLRVEETTNSLTTESTGGATLYSYEWNELSNLRAEQRHNYRHTTRVVLCL